MRIRCGAICLIALFTEDHSQNHPRVFIKERLMAFAFLAHDNYDSPRQLKITRVMDKFIDK